MKTVDLPDLERFVQRHRLGTWAEAIPAHFGVGALHADPAAQEYIVDQLSVEAQRDDPRFGRIHDWLLLGVATSAGAILSDYKLMRLLTPTAVPRRHVRKLAALYARLRDKGLSWMSPEAVRRLCAFSQFCALFAKSLSYRQAFEQAVARLPERAVRQTLASVELKFAGFQPQRSWKPPSPQAREHHDDSYEGYATGASYILTTRNRVLGLKRSDFGSVVVSEESVDVVEKLVDEANRLFELDQAEVDVFRGNYGCDSTGPSAWVVCPPDELQGRARELGNIETRFQEQIRHERHQNEKSAKFADLAKALFDKTDGKIFTFVETPVRRLVIMVPQPLAEALGREMLLSDHLFVEEIEMLEGISYELVASPQALRDFQLSDSLSMWDIFIFSRILRLLAMARNEALKQEMTRDTLSFLTSCLLLVTAEQFVEMLVLFGVDGGKAREYIKIFGWDVSDRNSFADLQYRPFITMGQHMVVPLAIHGTSNVLRNVLLVAQKRISAGGQPDMVTTHLHDSIRAVFRTIRRDLKFKYHGEQSDIDVVFLLGNTLFVCECKNSIKPASSFEMRATWDQLDKGAMQLDRIKRLWADAGFRRVLCERLQIPESAVNNLQTVLVLSHRLFSGARYREHPVRYLHSLIHFILEGTSAYSLPDGEHQSHHWKGSALTQDDLVSFLSDRGALYSVLFSAQRETRWKIAFGSTEMVRPRYPLNHIRLLAKLGVSKARRAALFDILRQQAAAEYPE